MRTGFELLSLKRGLITWSSEMESDYSLIGNADYSVIGNADYSVIGNADYSVIGNADYTVIGNGNVASKYIHAQFLVKETHDGHDPRLSFHGSIMRIYIYTHTHRYTPTRLRPGNDSAKSIDQSINQSINQPTNELVSG
jgi:hypothetical protein